MGSLSPLFLLSFASLSPLLLLSFSSLSLLFLLSFSSLPPLFLLSFSSLSPLFLLSFSSLSPLFGFSDVDLVGFSVPSDGSISLILTDWPLFLASLTSIWWVLVFPLIDQYPYFDGLASLLGFSSLKNKVIFPM